MNAAVTAIVLTLNEAKYLPGCLESLKPLTSDVIVLDSGSTDATIPIAVAAGARVEYRPFDGYANQRNAALELPGIAAWVLFIDADERLSQLGVREIQTEVSRASPCLAVLTLPRHNVFFGHTLKGGGWWPDHQSRVIRRGQARFDPERQIHEILRTRGRRKALQEPLTHLNYATWQEFRAKQRSYSRAFARDHAARRPAPSRKEYIGAPLREFRRRFITLHGYRDRWLGLRLAIAMAREELWIRWCIRRNGRCQP